MVSDGEAIPLVSRIIAVADAYNAMTSDRPYRDAMPSRVARLRLAQAVDSQFDTSVVAAFEAILAGADEGYRLVESGRTSLSSRKVPTIRIRFSHFGRGSRLISTLKCRLHSDSPPRANTELV